MSEKDVVERMITSNPTIVADLINFTIFDNEEVVSACELEIIPTHQSFVDSGGHLRSLMRDSAVKWKRNGVVFAFLGLESQTSIDPDMPLRVLGYDGASYREQLNNPNAVRYPVVTLVLYYGKEPWTKYLSLKERLNLPSEYAEKLGAYLNDYKINVIDIGRLTLEEIGKLRSDFAFIATICYQVGHPSSTIEYPSVHDIPLVAQFMHAFCDKTIEPVILENLLKQGGNNMDEIVAEYRDILFNQFREKVLEEGRAEGREEGRVEGRAEGRAEERQIWERERQNWEQERQSLEQKQQGWEQWQKEVVHTLSLKGYTSYEIAEILKVSQATVETWLVEQC